MDLNRYAELKAANAITLEKYQDDPVKVLVRRKQFDPNTGEQLADYVTEFDVASVRAERESLVARIVAIDEILADHDSCILAVIEVKQNNPIRENP